MFHTLFDQLKEIPDNRFYLIFVVLLIARLRHLTTINRFLSGIVNLFGTFFHELAHYVVGLILFARPTGFSVWPKSQEGKGTVLGSVSFGNLRFFNTLPTALAPLLLVILAYFIDQYFFSLIPQTTLTYFLFLFLIVLLLENAFPSATDISQALSNGAGILFYMVLALIVIFRERIAAEFSGGGILPF